MKRDMVHVISELREHLPYSIFSVAAGMIFLGILTSMANILGVSNISEPSEELFHVFHPVHLLFSATATTAMFWRHDKRVLKAAVIGFVGSVGICGISDVFMPFISGLLLGVKMHLHICIIEHPGLIVPFVLTGILAGFLISDKTQKSTILSHAAHVLVSSMASIFYLVAFGLTDWLHVAGMVFVYMVLAVIIPCCTSDIVFPLLFAKGHAHETHGRKD
ncbi:MAG: hypothetical protein KKD29_08060 [Candidatus Omnitrophica bacterium]|nr:hypothetical protein [Candidatus Omnitrophota bacterium]MBU4488852.1 hypothetical protein [Candidatus Omnitrophota bacterium]